MSEEDLKEEPNLYMYEILGEVMSADNLEEMQSCLLLTLASLPRCRELAIRQEMAKEEKEVFYARL